MTDLYNPAFTMHTITGILGDSLTDLRKKGEHIDDRVMHLYLDLVVAKLKAAAEIDALATEGRYASPND